MKRIRFWLGIVAGLLLVEAGYRGYLFQTYVVTLKFQVATIDRPEAPRYAGPDVHGAYLPGLTTWTRFSPDGELISRIKVHANNLGWISRFDYSVEREQGEYRIAMIGDSMTASINNEMPWPDFVQDYLNRDTELLHELGVTKFTVLNIAAAGASLEDMANTLTDISKRLQSDMVVVNFPIEAITRKGAPIRPVGERNLEFAPSPPINLPPADLEIDGVQINLFDCPAPRTIDNPACRVNPRWIVPPDRVFDAAELAVIKRELAAQIIWRRVLSSWKPLFLLELMKMPIIPRANATEYEPEVERAVAALGAIQQIYPNALFTYNPLYGELTGARRDLADKAMRLKELAASQGIEFVDMREYLPLQETGEDEWYTWFGLPFDGHFTDHGASIYGCAIKGAIRNHLLGNRQELSQAAPVGLGSLGQAAC